MYGSDSSTAYHVKKQKNKTAHDLQKWQLPTADVTPT